MNIPRGLVRPAGVAAIASLALLAAGGAARAPAGIWLGLPSPGSSLAIAAAALLLAIVTWRGGGLGPAAGFFLPVLPLLLGLPLAGTAALSGPPLLALAAAGAAAALACAGPRHLPRVALVPLCFAVFVVAGGRASVCVGPQGDEPHYLMVAESLLRDGDLALDGDYAPSRYAAFHDGPLAPHYRVRGRQREILSLHAAGLSVLILPAWALAGYAGVTVFMALVGALLVRELHALVLELDGREHLATATAVAAALSPPLLQYAGLVFTEVPAALLLLFALRRGRQACLGSGGAFAVGLAAAALPWLNVRYAPLALLAVGHALWRQQRLRSTVALLVPGIVSTAGIAVFHQLLYGFWDPRRVYGSRPEFAWSTLAEGLPGLLIDQEFGLLVYSPVLALALPGLILLLRRDRRLGLTVLGAVVSVLAMAGSWHMWRGGFNPPGRFLVPVAPLLFLAVALVWARRGLGAGAALLLGWGLWIGAAGALEPQLVHRDRDDTAPVFRALSGAREWTALLPGYVLEHPDRHRLALTWGLALLAAVPWRARRRPGRVPPPPRWAFSASRRWPRRWRASPRATAMRYGWRTPGVPRPGLARHVGRRRRVASR